MYSHLYSKYLSFICSRQAVKCVVGMLHSKLGCEVLAQGRVRNIGNNYSLGIKVISELIVVLVTCCDMLTRTNDIENEL